MGAAAVKAQGSTLHISGTGGAAKTITGIVVGNPTKLTIVAHGLSNGDSLTVAGATGADAALLNLAGLVVTHKTTDTFCLEVDTTGKTITATGTVTPLAWIKVGQISNIKATSDSVPDIDVTDLDSTVKEYVSGLADTGNVTGDIYCVDADAGQAAMAAAFASGASKTYKITRPAGTTPVKTFTGLIKSFPSIGDMSKDGVITGSVEIKRNSVITHS